MKIQALLHSPYARLMRLHQPTGVGLVYFPAAWAITCASNGLPSFFLLAFFLLCSLCIRGAGCIINDMWDKDFDKYVERTLHRPLASGELSIRQALIFLSILLTLCLIFLLMLPRLCIYLSLISLLPIILYPLMKRYTKWPQLFLGLTFNMGVFIGYAAVRDHLTLQTFLLYIGAAAWTLGYDTIYAFQDKKDDMKLGLYSVAITLDKKPLFWLSIFYKLCIICLSLVGFFSYYSLWYFLGIAVGAWHLHEQLYNLDKDDPASCKKVFQSNLVFGSIIFCAFLSKNL